MDRRECCLGGALGVPGGEERDTGQGRTRDMVAIHRPLREGRGRGYVSVKKGSGARV